MYYQAGFDHTGSHVEIELQPMYGILISKHNGLCTRFVSCTQTRAARLTIGIFMIGEIVKRMAVSNVLVRVLSTGFTLGDFLSPALEDVETHQTCSQERNSRELKAIHDDVRNPGFVVSRRIV